MQNAIIRKSEERGYFNHGWLRSYHTFSFGEYYDENFMNYHTLRVINEDVIRPNTGFGLHPHKNMEIITYVLSGVLTHSDNLGNREEIPAGSFQVMSAGSGIIHGEFNHSNASCHLLQMWVMTNEKGGKPYYKIHKPNHFEKWVLIVSGNGLENSVQIRQNAKMYAIDSGSLKSIKMPNGGGYFWLQIASGIVKFGEIILHAGDAIGFERSSHFETTEFLEKSRVVLFEL